MPAPADGVEASTAQAWLAAPISLRPGVEMVVGANDERLLVVPDPVRYLRLTPGAAKMLPILNGRVTGDHLVNRVSERAGPERADVQRSIIGFFEELRRAGALTVDPEPCPDRNRRPAGRALRSPIRLPLTRSVDHLVRWPATALRQLPRRLVVGAAAVSTVVALAMAIVALVRSPAIVVPSLPRLVIVVIGALLLQLIVHESAHAVVCVALGVPVRETGLIVWCFVFPVPYVDCTDAYRLRRRGARAAIALAGPYVDVLALGGSAAVWLLLGAPTGSTVHAVMVVQLVVLVATVNPMLPGDGHHAIEAVTGELNLRGRAFAVLGRRVRGRALLPSYGRLPPMRQAWYLGYLLFTVLYSVAAGLFVVRVGMAFIRGANG